MNLKTSLILTVYNEEKTISDFLKSLKLQSQKPSETIIVDGASSDKTKSIIEKFIRENKNLNIHLIVKKGNISIGRNTAIKFAKNNLILCTDAGCILDKNWVKKISDSFKSPKVEVVSGFYKPTGKSIFQKCLGTYTSVMSDKLDEENYLPSSRSIAFKKSAWEKAGKYPQWLDRGEDLYFAKKLKEKNVNFKFVKDAIVYWSQKKNIKDAFMQFFGYAKGDGIAKNYRPQIPFIYLRYLFAFYLLFLTVLERSFLGIIFLFIFLSGYFLWAIKKNYKYVKEKKAIIYLPLLQITSDIAVMTGFGLGLLKNVTFKKILQTIKNNKFLILVLSIYSFFLLYTLRWGIPNFYHPFPYHMDEWHQFQAARSIAKYGTPNVLGSANGPMFQYLSYTIYLIPFTLLKIINPISLEINDWVMRERIFELLRINTIIYGNLAIIVFYKILKILRIPKETIIFFVFTPIFIILSGYFKYDIALLFWINVTILFFIRFAKNPTRENYLLAAIPAALSISAKLSAMPFAPLYILVFFMFSSSWRKNIKTLIFGLLLFSTCILFFTIPDTLFGKGSPLLVFYENVIDAPKDNSNFIFNTNVYFYLLKTSPILYGWGVIILFILSSITFPFLILKKNKNKVFEYRIEIFIFVCIVLFILSLIPLKIFASGNKLLVLLPFMVLIIGFVFREFSKNKKIKNFIRIALYILLFIQIIESVLWMRIKIDTPIQVASSKWITSNIKHGETIGLENIPIYQNIPEILQKEFYYADSGVENGNLYQYKIVDSNTQNLPDYIVITNDALLRNLQKKSPKKELVIRLEKSGYKKLVTFKVPKPYSLSDVDGFHSGLFASPFTVSVYKR